MTVGHRNDEGRLRQAAAWRMELDRGGTDRTLFDRWLANPDNAAAWNRLEAALGLMTRHANDPRMLELRRAARHDSRHANIGSNINASVRSRRLTTRSWALSIAATLLIGIIGLSAYHRFTAPDDYTTSLDERRIITLADGSRIALDSDSEVTVRYTTARRELQLLRGQARFDVARDVTRPFYVQARDRKVVATGTAFNIDLTDPRTRVTLIEGHVVVLENEGSRAPREQRLNHPQIELQAGQQLTAGADLAPTIAPVDMRQVISWTSGQLLFDDQPLAEVVSKVNHYARRPISIADARTARLRVSGSFNTGDTAGFIDIITHFLPVRATIGADNAIVLREE